MQTITLKTAFFQARKKRMNSLATFDKQLRTSLLSYDGTAIRLQNVSVRYRVLHERFATLKEHAIRWLERRVQYDDFWALRDISLQIAQGETLGVIGRNGSGKSTLLKVISRVMRPTRGRVWIRGSVAPLLELGAGFHLELTGRENIFLNGTLLGHSRREIEKRFDEIVNFAEIRDFIDVPLRTYSTGMIARLGFAVATEWTPDILLLDETLSVGDAEFQQKCITRINQFRERGKTVIIVSHDLSRLQELCSHILWLEDNKVKQSGEASRVIASYLESMQEREAQTLDQINIVPLEQEEPPEKQIEEPISVPTLESTTDREMPNDVIENKTTAALWKPVDVNTAEREKRWGSGKVLITQVEMFAGDGTKTWVIENGSSATLCLHYSAKEAQSDAVFSVTIHRPEGVYIAGTNTMNQGLKLNLAAGNGIVRVHFPSIPLCHGSYFISVGVFLEPDPPYWTHPADFHNKAYEFHVHAPDAVHGLVQISASWDYEFQSARN